MRIIEIQPLENGAHRNQTTTSTAIPTGWAEIPADVAIPETFPFVDIQVEGNKVVSMTAGVVPEPPGWGGAYDGGRAGTEILSPPLGPGAAGGPAGGGAAEPGGV